MKRSEHEKEIAREQKRLQTIFENVPDSKKETVAGLIENAAFMRCELKQLRQDILTHGAVVSAKTGNGYEKTTENPCLKNYNSMLGKYNYCIKLLLSLLPEENPAHDELQAWLESH